jgi:prefoldin subunit 5
MEVDIDQKIKQARQNIMALQSQLAEIQQKATQLNDQIIKWQGVLEFFISLKNQENKEEEAAVQ